MNENVILLIVRDYPWELICTSLHTAFHTT